jgi:hypothetical protein
MSALTSVQEWATLIRDVGVILGVPVLIGIGVKLYELQHKAAEAQIKANEAQIKAIESQVKVVEAQNAALKDTQYDKALALLKSQEELFNRERSDSKLATETLRREYSEAILAIYMASATDSLRSSPKKSEKRSQKSCCWSKSGR